MRNIVSNTAKKGVIKKELYGSLIKIEDENESGLHEDLKTQKNLKKQSKC